MILAGTCCATLRPAASECVSGPTSTTSCIAATNNKHRVNTNPIVEPTDRWQARLWSLIEQLDAEARARQRTDAEVTVDELVEAFDARADGRERKRT
jgi:hypothetical protein